MHSRSAPLFCRTGGRALAARPPIQVATIKKPGTLPNQELRRAEGIAPTGNIAKYYPQLVQREGINHD
jgi:hypothetical protein